MANGQIGSTPGGIEIATSPQAASGGGGGGVTGVTGTTPIHSSGGAAPNITIDAATTSARGTMSAADKAKLDGLSAGVTAVTGTAPIASSGGTTPDISIAAATTLVPGSMSAADKTKLDSVTAGAAVAGVSGTGPIVSSGGTTPAISLLNSGHSLGRLVCPVQIDYAALTAASSFVSANWTPGKYREIIVKFQGSFSAFSYLGFRANTDAGTNYEDIGLDNNTAASNDGSAGGVLGFARCGVLVSAGACITDEIRFFPLTDGNNRVGWSIGGSMTGTLGSSYQRIVSFGWLDTTTDVTGISLLPSAAATITGVVNVYGIPD